MHSDGAVLHRRDFLLSLLVRCGVLDTMKWIVGLDLHPSGVGALRFARWLAETSSAIDQMVGIHVLEESYLQGVLRYHHLDEVLEGAEQAACDVIAGVDASQHFGPPHILQGTHAESSIDAAHTYHAADGVIIGRQAKRDGREIVRLGRVARRVLRTLCGPTLVIPPDYDPDVSDGPIIASCSMRGDGEEAVCFARDMARRMKRDLVLVHVVPTPDDYAAHYLPEASLERVHADNQRAAETALHRWAQEHDCDPCEQVVAQGGIVEELVELARDRKACMLVSGSRRLSTFERILLTSIASELAAVGPCPVAVVPPPRMD